MDEFICAHCGEPIEPEDVVYPFVNSDNPTHSKCAVDAALMEVSDVYSSGGAPALEEYDKEADLQASMLN